MDTPESTSPKSIDELPAVIMARNALFEAEQELGRHKATWDEKTMSEQIWVKGFGWADEKGNRYDIFSGFRDNPNYNFFTAHLYFEKSKRLKFKVDEARKKYDEIKSYYKHREQIKKTVCQIPSLPIHAIRFARSLFRKIEKATRPNDEQ